MSEEKNDGQAMVKATPSSEYTGLAMVVTPIEALAQLQQLQAFVQKVMVNNTDYGVIPGTDKPTLLQPGAQKLCEIYGFASSYDDTGSVMDWDRGFFLFRKRCVLTSRRDGRFIGDGIGSCNSKESRYGARWVFESEVPKHLDKTTLPTRSGINKYKKPYTQFKVPNEDIFSLVNTIEKMASKRALIHAVIGATRSAGIFTQDVEDLPPEAYGAEERQESTQQKAQQQQRPAKQQAPVPDAEFTEEKAEKAPPDYDARSHVLRAEFDAAKTKEEAAAIWQKAKAALTGSGPHLTAMQQYYKTRYTALKASEEAAA